MLLIFPLVIVFFKRFFFAKLERKRQRIVFLVIGSISSCNKGVLPWLRFSAFILTTFKEVKQNFYIALRHNFLGTVNIIRVFSYRYIS